MEHEGTVNSVALTESNRHVVTASDDKSLIIWSLETGLVEHRLQGHTDCVTVVKVTADGCTAISGGSLLYSVTSIAQFSKSEMWPQ